MYECCFKEESRNDEGMKKHQVLAGSGEKGDCRENRTADSRWRAFSYGGVEKTSPDKRSEARFPQHRFSAETFCCKHAAIH